MAEGDEAQGTRVTHVHGGQVRKGNINLKPGFGIFRVPLSGPSTASTKLSSAEKGRYFTQMAVHRTNRKTVAAE